MSVPRVSSASPGVVSVRQRSVTDGEGDRRDTGKPLSSKRQRTLAALARSIAGRGHGST